MINLNELSLKELQDLYMSVHTAIQERKNERCEELIQKVCDAMNTLQSEFPYVELSVPYH